MGSWKNIIATVIVLALIVRVLAALITLENYRYANSRGLCAEFDVKDPVARVLKEECLDKSINGLSSVWLLYKAIF